MSPAPPRRVAVTGLGAIAAPGASADPLWQALCAGRSGIQRVDGQAFPQARVDEAAYRAQDHFERRELALLDRVGQFARVAARQAMGQAFGAAAGVDLGTGTRGDSRPGARSGEAAGGATSGASAHSAWRGAGVPPWLAQADLDPARCGVIFGASVGHQTVDDGYFALYGRADGRADSRGEPRLHPALVPRGMPSAPASLLSIAYGLQGPSFATASACASAAHALGLAFQAVRSGLLDLCLSGGAEASLVPGMLRAWEGLHVQSADTCRPFSRDRSGLVLGEGGAVLVLEEWQHARRRGAKPLAELVGFGMSADARDMTIPDPAGAARAMQAALADAGLKPAAVDYVNAHGTGTRLNDRSEAAALAQVFGWRLAELPVSSCKGQIGHCLNAAGALEAFACVRALQDGLLPPTVGFREPDPECALDCVPGTARRADIRVAISNSFAFGGLNAVLVLRRAE